MLLVVARLLFVVLRLPESEVTVLFVVTRFPERVFTVDVREARFHEREAILLVLVST